MKNIAILIAVSLLSGIALTSCSKDPLKDMTPEESRIYVTQKDSTADFSVYKTFAVTDSVAVVNNSGSGKELTPGDKVLRNLIIDKMKDRGYIQVDPDDSPDMGINITRISYTYLNAVSTPYYDYWGYPGYWDTGFWGYPGYDYFFPSSFGFYPSSFMYYNTQSDMMTIDLIDLENVKSQNLDAIWSASLRGTDVLNPDNYPGEIDAIFSQSPYLTTSN